MMYLSLPPWSKGAGRTVEFCPHHRVHRSGLPYVFSLCSRNKQPGWSKKWRPEQLWSQIVAFVGSENDGLFWSLFRVTLYKETYALKHLERKCFRFSRWSWLFCAHNGVFFNKLQTFKIFSSSIFTSLLKFCCDCFRCDVFIAGSEKCLHPRKVQESNL